MFRGHTRFVLCHQFETDRSSEVSATNSDIADIGIWVNRELTGHQTWTRVATKSQSRQSPPHPQDWQPTLRRGSVQLRE